MLSLKFISLLQHHWKKTAFLLQKIVAILVFMNILWLYFIMWDWFRKHLINILVLSLWSWCCLCFVVLLVVPYPDSVIDKQGCLQCSLVFACLNNLLSSCWKEKCLSFRCRENGSSSYTDDCYWQCPGSVNSETIFVTLPQRPDEFGPRSWHKYFS